MSDETALSRPVLFRHVEFLQTRLGAMQEELRAAAQREAELWRRILALELQLRGLAA